MVTYCIGAFTQSNWPKSEFLQFLAQLGGMERLSSEATASSKAFQQRIFYFVAQTPPK
jgi:hypothetical protein